MIRHQFDADFFAQGMVVVAGHQGQGDPALVQAQGIENMRAAKRL